MTQYQVGVLQPPDASNPRPAQEQMQIQVLNAMANPPQDATAPDPTAGLYAGKKIDPNNLPAKLDGPGAFNLLKHKKSVFFHAPNGAFEQMKNLGDLDAYIYAQQTSAPDGAAVLPQ